MYSRLTHARRAPCLSFPKLRGCPLLVLLHWLMPGQALADFDLPENLSVNRFFIKSPVFPFCEVSGSRSNPQSRNAFNR